MALRVLRDKGERVRQRLDPLGMVTLGLGLFGVLWAITKLANGPFDAATAGYLIGGVALIGVFVVHRVAGPRADAAAADLQGPDDGGLAVRVPVPGAGQLRGAVPAC